MSELPNWFAMYADRWFDHHLRHLAGRDNVRALQIGAYTGDASVWLLDNVLTGDLCHLDDVDTWGGSDEHQHHAIDWTEVRRIYQERMATRPPGQVTVHVSPSRPWLAKLPTGPWYDFIYIDGDHHAPAVLTDAVLAFRLLRPHGLLAFDDYLWTEPGQRRSEQPRGAIDAFLAVYEDELDRLPDPPWAQGPSQVWVRRR